MAVSKDCGVDAVDDEEAVLDALAADPLFGRHIEPDPYKPGAANARLRDSGVHVWALVGYLGMVEGDVERVAADYELPLDAVQAALAYYDRFRAAIDARLAANAA